jgi:transcriptional regulator with XRE-family HTH domain
MLLGGRQCAGARGLLGLSRREVAQAIGVSEKTLANFEVGVHTPRAETLEKLREFFEKKGMEFTNGDYLGIRLRIKRS